MTYTPPRRSGSVREHKRHYNKPDQQFDCERLFQDRETLILRYVADREYTVAGRVTPPGSSTVGLYRQGEDYVFWKMLRPDHSLDGYLIHVCEPVQLLADEVVYRDLMLDIWQTPRLPPVLLDEDDVENALASGLITPETARQARDIAHRLLADFDDVVARASLDFALMALACPW